METNKTFRKSYFRSITDIPLKIFRIIFNGASLLLLAILCLLLLSAIYLGIYVYKHLDEPLSNTPYPATPQPPEDLTFREFYNTMDVYYDNLIASNSRVEDIGKNVPSNVLNNNAFLIKQIILSPLLSGAIVTETFATINSEGFFAQNLSEKDFQQNVEPLLGQYEGYKDFPQVFFLQIQGNYWRLFGKEFSSFYSEELQ